jgi:sirohydrochlorin cobaltochelatase
MRERQPAGALRLSGLSQEPSLPDDAASAFVASGCRHLRIFPLFYRVGKHAREDLPLLVADIKTNHPADVSVELLATAGKYPP